jgi:hypothetical protein
MDAALPFLSTTAGLLAVAEMVKATLDGYPVSPNFAVRGALGNGGEGSRCSEDEPLWQVSRGRANEDGETSLRVAYKRSE